MATPVDSAEGVASGSPLVVHVRDAPRDEGTVELIARRPSVDEREVVGEAVLDVEEGLVGDNWRARGRSGGRRPPNPDAQITVMSSRAIALATGERDRWPLAGDQLTFTAVESGHGNDRVIREAIGGGPWTKVR